MARSLLEGRGFAIEVVPFHPGWFESATRVPEMHGLLRAFMLWPLFALVGPASALLQAVGFGYVALTGWLAFVFARRLFGTGAGWLGLALTLSNGVLFFFGWAGTDDVGFACFFLAALAAFDRALDTGDTRWFAAAGLAAGLAMLEKLSGVVLPVTFCVVWLLIPRQPVRPDARRVALLLTPFALALGAYLLRNLAAHGGLDFRFSPLAWMLKARGYGAFHAFYEQAPTLSGVIREIGWERLPGLALAQLGALLEAVFVLPGSPGRRLSQDLSILGLGLPLLLVHARSQPRFALSAGVATLASIGFFCGVHHVEPRYFAMLVPLAAISLAGAVVAGLRAQRRTLRVAAALVVAVQIFCTALRLSVVADAGWIGSRAAAAGCPAAFAWLAKQSAPGDVVLSLDPWRVAWETRRAAVMIPEGPAADVLRVARHYRAGWLLASPSAARPELARRLPQRAIDELGATPVLQDAGCRLFRLPSEAELP